MYSSTLGPEHFLDNHKLIRFSQHLVDCRSSFPRIFARRDIVDIFSLGDNL